MLGSLFTQFQLSSRASEGAQGQSQEQIPTLADFLQQVKWVSELHNDSGTVEE